MAHTYTNLLSHVVFSTQGHIPSIKEEYRKELFAYMAALVKEKGGKPMIVNGIEDHVHMLFTLPPNVSLSEVLRFVKANSSRWFKQRFRKPFAWQKGFGAFSVARSNVETVAKYIRDQESHHYGRDFRSEFVALLDKNGVEYDAALLWK